MKKKILYSTLFVLLLIVIVGGGTYAWLIWTSSVNLNGTTECFDINYVKGGDIGSDSSPAKFNLASSYTEGLSTIIKVNIKNTCSITNGTGTLYLNTDTSSSTELLTNKVLKYQVLEDGTEKTNGVITSTGKLAIYSNIPLTSTVKTFTIYIWIDGNLVNDTNSNDILSSIYKGNITMDIESGDK